MSLVFISKKRLEDLVEAERRHAHKDGWFRGVEWATEQVMRGAYVKMMKTGPKLITPELHAEFEERRKNATPRPERCD